MSHPDNQHSLYEAQFPSDDLLDRLEAYETATRNSLRRVFGWYGQALNQFFLTYNVRERADWGMQRISVHRENFLIHA